MSKMNLNVQSLQDYMLALKEHAKEVAVAATDDGCNLLTRLGNIET